MMANPTNQNQPLDAAAEDQDPQVMQVKVINRNDFLIRDMFDGVAYDFHPNRPVSIPIDAANHIFGWWPPFNDDEGHRHEVEPEMMKRHIMKRLGWNTPAMQQDGRSELFYKNLVVQPIFYRMVPVEVSAEAMKGRPAGRDARA
jgi:hypothetical protein